MMKIKKILIYFAVIFILFNVYILYKRYSPGFSLVYKANLKNAGDMQEFEFTTKGGDYIIGFCLSSQKYNSMIFDGNYTIKYYLNDKLERTEIINKTSRLKIYTNKGLYSRDSIVSGGIFKPVVWKSLPLGKIMKSGKHKIEITVIKPESQFKKLKSQLYFYADNSYLKDIKRFGWDDPKYKEKKRRERLLKNLINAKETNTTLIPLRKALDDNNLSKVKEIIESNNNITVNTDMVFQRRALHYASFQNNVEIVKYLIDKGADIHHKDALNKNALAYAIENNATKTAKLLLDSGVDVSEVPFVQNYLSNKIKQRHKGRVMSALQYTAGNALFEMTELLLRNGMKDNIIVSEASNINIYTYIYYYTTMNTKEKKQMQQLFDKYGVEVKKIDTRPTIKFTK